MLKLRQAFFSLLFISFTATASVELETIVRLQQKQMGVEGTAVGIIKDGKIVLAQGFGYRNKDERKHCR